MAKKRLRVAFFADILIKDFDGAVRTMYQLIDRIPENQYDFKFFCGTAPKHEFKHNIETIPSIVIPFNNTYRMTFPYWEGHLLKKSLEKFNPDVIHIATPSLLGFFALNYAKKNNIPVLSIYHTHFISYIKYYLKSMPFFIHSAEAYTVKKYNDFYNQCDIVYTPSNQMISILEKLGIEKKRMKFWQRGLDTQLFNPSKRDRSFMKKITGNDKPCILFASRLVWEKNLETLFEVYRLAKKQKLEVNFIVAGDGVAYEVARQQMKDAFFLGYVDHNKLSKIYASSDFLVFPSVTETYGNVVVEAMASGCIPVIARGGGSQYLVRDKETGFLCEPNHAPSYLNHIKELLGNADLRMQIQQAGLQYTSLLSWENLANEYFEDLRYLAELKPKKTTVLPFPKYTPTKTGSRQWAVNA